jgi:hypothetical protein
MALRQACPTPTDRQAGGSGAPVAGLPPDHRAVIAQPEVSGQTLMKNPPSILNKQLRAMPGARYL